jgi:hypothetical protein
MLCWGAPLTDDVVFVPLCHEGLSRATVDKLRRAVSLDVSRLATVDAELVVEAPYLRRRQLVDPVHFHCVECHGANVVVRREVLSEASHTSVHVKMEGVSMFWHLSHHIVVGLTQLIGQTRRKFHKQSNIGICDSLAVSKNIELFFLDL